MTPAALKCQLIAVECFLIHSRFQWHIQDAQQQLAHSERIDVIFSKWRLGNVLFLFESAMTRWIIEYIYCC